MEIAEYFCNQVKNYRVSKKCVYFLNHPLIYRHILIMK